MSQRIKPALERRSVQTHVLFTVPEIDRVDQAATQRAMSRSDFIRAAVQAYVAAQSSEAAQP